MHAFEAMFLNGTSLKVFIFLTEALGSQGTCVPIIIQSVWNVSSIFCWIAPCTLLGLRMWSRSFRATNIHCLFHLMHKLVVTLWTNISCDRISCPVHYVCFRDSTNANLFHLLYIYIISEMMWLFHKVVFGSVQFPLACYSVFKQHST